MTQKTTPSSTPINEPVSQKGSVAEVARLFLRMGFTAFGGPAAHIAMFRDEVVTRRKWITDEEFMDLLGATNLIPGPNSTEMAIHIGYARAGWRGLLAAGLCFIGPAAIMVLILAALYVNFGSTPTAIWLLYGIKPVMIAVVAQALWGLLKTAVKGRLLAVLGVAVFVLYLLRLNEFVLLFGAGFLYMLLQNIGMLRVSLTQMKIGNGLRAIGVAGGVVALFSLLLAISFDTLFLIFLKIGSLLYGSGYVLLAFLRNDFVERLGWLSNQQLLDAVAIGQFTPGPVFTTATFIGYVIGHAQSGWLGGLWGAVQATIGIFLPSFVFVLVTSPFIPRMRRSPWLSALLDGVNVAALGLMGAVTLELARTAIIDVPTLLLAIGAAVLLIRFKINTTWLIIAGGVIGLIVSVILRTA